MFNSNSVPSLYSQDTFDRQFIRDIKNTRTSLLIESPFIRINHIKNLVPIFSKLRSRGVEVIINTRSPDEHNDDYRIQAIEAVALLQDLGVKVLYTVKHHRKLAIIDRETLYEGSLNILSYYDSCEIMRRTVSTSEAEALIHFIGLNQYLTKAN